MSTTYDGVVRFANGAPAPGVQVRLFDKDLMGSDDDLTIRPGNSDAQGRFSVDYAPDRDLDFLDIYLPYLHFEYQLNGRPRQHRAFIQPMTNIYPLPEMTPVKFIPAEHGFQFTNRFPGFWLPFSVPSIPDIPPIKKDDIYGLCGGMSAAALDFLDHGRPIPQRRRVPGRARPLHQYIHQRQVDSLGLFGRQVERFARWMILSDDAVQRRTAVEFEKLKQSLDNGRPRPIGLVYISSRDSLQLWKNHQVLACDYQVAGSAISIQIYDPNFPRRNDIFIRCQASGQNSLASEQTIGKSRKKNVRGFFVMPYESVEPPAGLTEQS